MSLFIEVLEGLAEGDAVVMTGAGGGWIPAFPSCRRASRPVRADREDLGRDSVALAAGDGIARGGG